MCDCLMPRKEIWMHRSSSTLSNFKWRLKILKHKRVVPQKTTLFTGTQTQKNKLLVKLDLHFEPHRNSYKQACFSGLSCNHRPEQSQTDDIKGPWIFQIHLKVSSCWNILFHSKTKINHFRNLESGPGKILMPSTSSALNAICVKKEFFDDKENASYP